MIFKRFSSRLHITGSEVMQQVIFELSKKYMNLGKSIDDEYILELLSIMIYYCKVEDYLPFENISFQYGKGKAMLYYFKKQLTIYINVFEEQIELAYRDSSVCPRSIQERILFMHRIVIFALRHEVAHIEQIRDLDVGKNGAEADIMNLTYMIHTTNVLNYTDDEIEQERFFEREFLKIARALLLCKEKYLYNTYYRYAPEERLANIKGHEQVLDWLPFFEKYYGIDTAKLVSLERYRMLRSLLKVYDKSLPPSTYYLEKFHHKRAISICESFDNLSLEERFALGLRLSEDELALKREEESEIQKRISFYK